jgi:hypothetical protein
VLGGDDGQVVFSFDVRNIDLRETGSERRREVALSEISRWIHGRKEAKVWVPRNRLGLAFLNKCDRTPLKETRETLQRLGRGKVYLVEQEPMASPKSLHKNSVDIRECERSSLRGRV